MPFTPPAPEDIIEEGFVPPSPEDILEGGERLTASELATIDSEAAAFPKKPAPGIAASFIRGVKQPFKSFGMAPGIALLSDEKLGEHLEEEYRNLNRQEATGVPAQVAETVGGLVGTVGQLVAHQALANRVRVPQRLTAAATFGTSGAYNAFLKAGMNALSEGKTTDEALSIAKKASLVGAGVGAATGAVLPPGAQSFRQALKQGAMLGGLGAAGAATENVGERVFGLQTPISEGVVPSVGTMGAIPPVVYGLSLALRSRARPVIPRAPRRASLEDAGVIEAEAAAQSGQRKLLVDPYSTPMLERLDTLGGPASKNVAAQGRQIDVDAVALAGRIGPVVDKARQLAARAFRGGTTWIRDKDDVTPNAAIARLHTLEGLDRAEVIAKAPPEAREMVDAIWEANTTAIGGLAAEANVGFAPQGKVQRILTPRGMDILLESDGTIWNNLVEGNAKANGKTVAETKDFFREFKEVIDDPVPDQAKVDKISQDFYREFPKAITHVKSGPQWIEVLVSDPVDYLKAATDRTARAAAFRKVYPNNEAGRQALVDTHKSVLAELPTATRKEEFNNLIKTLQGHRLDSDIEMSAAGIPGAQPVMEAAGAVARPLRASMLSLSSLANASETVIGGPAIFLRYKNVIPLLTKNPKRLYNQLEMAGLVDKATRNFAWNPITPAKSVSRIVSEGIGRLSMSNFFNEVQEYTGSGSAALMADAVRLKKLSPGEVKDFESVLRAMGFRDNYKEIASGADQKGLMQFEAQAAPFLSGGHQRPATTSRLGNSRAFNSLFWFHRYPQMVLNQFRGILNNLIEDVQKGNRGHFYTDSKLMARFIGLKAAAGALMGLIVTAAKEGKEGVDQKLREARESFTSFLWQSTLNAIGGPLQIAARIGQKADTGEEAAIEAIKVSAPVATGIDLFNAVTGKGRYNGLGTFDTAATFLQSKTPAVAAVRSMIGVTGLADDNPKLRAATGGFYRWAQKQGYKWPEGRPKDAEFTQAMRKTVKVMERGGEWQEELQKAMQIKADKGGDARKSAKQSLNSRKILRNQFGGALTADEIDSLRAWLGDDNFQILQQRDAMVDAVADVF